MDILDEEVIVEDTPEETGIEANDDEMNIDNDIVGEEEVETTEENPIGTSIDYSLYSEVGTPEEIQGLVGEILGEEYTEAEMKVAIKFLEKAQKEGLEDKEAKVQQIEQAKVNIFENPPIPKAEFKALQVWLRNQPQELQDELSEKTNFEKHSEEEIRNAIIEANRLRVGTVKSVPRTTQSSGKGTTWTKEKAMSTYENIGVKYSGFERTNKINILKKEIAKSNDTELKAWAKSFFGN